MSKGSKRRPQQIDEAEMERRWKLAFERKRKSWRQLCEEGWEDARRELTHLFDKPKER